MLAGTRGARARPPLLAGGRAQGPVAGGLSGDRGAWPAHGGHRYVLTGPSAPTYREIAAVIEAETGIHAQVVDVTPEQAGQVARAKDGEWIELFRPITRPPNPQNLNGPDFWQPGVFHSERLVNMAHHNYREEPNVRFSPDKSLVLFTSNMFGPSYVFGVEVKKAANPPAADIQSTPQLAATFNPGKPTPTTTPK